MLQKFIRLVMKSKIV